MARTTAPLMSLDASGSVANSIVFSKWRGRNYVRRWAIPSNPNTGLQRGIRSVFKFLTQSYAGLSGAIKTNWEALAAPDNITGLNAMIRKDIDLARRNQGWMRDPQEAVEPAIDAPTGPAAAAQPKTLVCTWVRPVANQGDFSAALYMSTTGGFTPDISNLVYVGAVATLSATIPNLVTGTTYYFKVRETGGGGKLGTLSAEFNGTPT